MTKLEQIKRKLVLYWWYEKVGLLETFEFRCCKYDDDGSLNAWFASIPEK